jgi:glycerol-1-phosphate dehydrogenase [NAD(P)+]
MVLCPIRVHVWGGEKSTIYTPCPVAVIADIDIMRQAPMRMLQAGLGDMLAKYVSICEWRISNVVQRRILLPSDCCADAQRRGKDRPGRFGSGAARPAGVQRVVEGLVLPALP